MGHPRPLFRLFLVFFKQTIQFLQQINVKKCPSSIWCRDSNPQPLECESPPITTRPGLNKSLHHQDEKIVGPYYRFIYVHLKPHWAPQFTQQNLALILQQFVCQQNKFAWGSVGGSVGRAVASDSRGPLFKSSHWQKLCWKDENKEKEAGIGPFKK